MSNNDDSRLTLKSFLSDKYNVNIAKPRITFTRKDDDLDGLDHDGLVQTSDPLLDLNNPSRGLLGDYLQYISENSNSFFKIHGKNVESNDTSRGNPIPKKQNQGGDNFINHGDDKDLYNSLESYSNSGQFDNLDLILDKTGQGIPSVVPDHSNNLLKDVKGKKQYAHKDGVGSAGMTLVDGNTEDEDAEISKGINNVLKNNRFSNINPSRTGRFTKTAFATQQGGNLNPENFDDADVTPNASVGEGTLSIPAKDSFGYSKLDPVSLEKLKMIGTSLLYKASGFDQGQAPRATQTNYHLGNLMDDGNTSGKFNVTEPMKVLSYKNNEFNFVESNLLKARKAKGFPENPNNREESARSDAKGRFMQDDPDAFNAGSYGQSYNSELNFDKKGHVMHKLKAAIACASLKSMATEFLDKIKSHFDKISGEIIESESGKIVLEYEKYEGPGPHLMGVYKSLPSSKFDSILKRVFVRTDFPYGECFKKGVFILFGSTSLSVSQQGGQDADIVKMIQANSGNTVFEDSPGFWLAIASSILKSVAEVERLLVNGQVSNSSQLTFNSLYDIAKSNKILNFANVAATIGDIYFRTSNGLKEYKNSGELRRLYDVDSFPTTPATRVSKSRDSAADSPLAMSWRQNSVPSMYILPENVIRAAVDLDNSIIGTNPAKGMLGSSLIRNTYLGSSLINKNLQGSNAKIPSDVVKRLEDKLDAEYVPFYIQDLRTNEILSFHAFLTQLTDSIQPNFNEVAGYGRMDSVKVYNNTKRTVNVGFTLYATSKEDFNDMWYKINKLVTLLYPQWTQGMKLSSTGFDSFIQPFSQVIGASPIVRLRVGDVIKSNYSKFNLARLFGIGDDDIFPVPNSESKGFFNGTDPLFSINKAKGAVGDKMARDGWSKFALETFNVLFGSPLQYLPQKLGSRRKTQGMGAIRNFASLFLINGFVNPLGPGMILNSLRDPNKIENDFNLMASKNLKSFAKDSLAQGGIAGQDFLGGYGYHPLQRVFLKHNMTRGYQRIDGVKFYLDRPIRVMVSGYKNRPGQGELTDSTKINQTTDFKNKRQTYSVIVIDPNAKDGLFGEELIVDHADILPDPSEIFNFTAGPFFAAQRWTSFADYLVTVGQDFAASTGLGAESINFIRELWSSNASQFMFEENNPFVRAFKSTMGRGLAGVIKGINFNWLENNIAWETDHNSRAPIGCQISFQFDVIHDIPPGMDHAGYNRAPLYNVGDIMKNIAGDPHEDDIGSNTEYRLAGIGSIRSKGKIKD